MGIRWRRRFPGASKSAIREFLNLFLDAFLIPRKRRSCFSPDDRVLDVYRALVPPGCADSLEIETLARGLETRYGLALETLSHLTLGELFERTGTQPA